MAFANNGACATNCVFRGLVFSSFRFAALYISSTQGGMTVEDCVFLANNSASQNYAAVTAIDAPASISRCAFTNNYHALMFTTTSATTGPVTNVVRDCTFDRAHQLGYQANVRISDWACADIARCSFTHGVSVGQYATAVRYDSSKLGGFLRMEDCLVQDNLATGGGNAGVCLDNGVATKPVEIVRCRFIGNIHTNTTSAARAVAVSRGSNGYATFRDCYFAGNRHELTGGSSPAGSVLYMSSGSKTTFVNCTFETNAVSTTVSAMKGGTFVANDQSGQIALVNCLVHGSVLTGGTSAEFVFNAGNTSGSTLALHNTIVYNATPGYQPFNLHANVRPAFADSSVSGIDIGSLPTGDNGYLYLDASIQGADPCLKPRLECGAKGAWARKIGPNSPYLRRGHPVWAGTDGNCYFRDETANPDKPWRRVIDKNTFLTDAAAADLGLSASAAPIADAFGDARHLRRIDLGPLNAQPAPTLLIWH